MPRKAVKAQAKKKQVKKNLRRKLLKKHNIESSVNPTSSQPLVNPSNSNSIRNQLLLRGGIQSMGFAPQQYGNINNDRKIQQLKNDTQTSTQQVTNEKAIIDTLTQQLNQSTADSKNLKKQIKDLNRKLEKATSEREMMQDEVSDAERIDDKTHKELLRKNALERRRAEANRQNEIIQNKTKADSLESEIHREELNHEELQRKYMENHYYKDLETKNIELQRLKNENKALETVLKSNDFLDTNKEITMRYQEIEKERFKNELLKKEQQKKEELLKSQLELESIPNQEDLKAITEQHVSNIIQLEKQKLQMEDDIKRRQIPIEKYNHMLELEKKLNNQSIDIQNEQFKLWKQQQILEDEVNRKVESNIESKVKDLGKQIALLDIQKEGNEQLKSSLAEKKKAMFENSKAQANIQFQNSPEMQAINKDILKIQADTISYQNQAAQRNLLHEQQKEMQKAILANQVSQQTIDGGLSNVEQVQFIISNEIQPRINDFQAKEQLVGQLNELIRTNQEAWNVFSSMNQNLVGISQYGYRNASKDQIQYLINTLITFIKSYHPPPKLNYNEESDSD